MAGFPRALLLAVLLISVPLAPLRAGAQPLPVGAGEPSDEWSAPRWVGHVTFAGSSALLGGLTAGILQRIDGGEFRDGFARGALGGATTYAGRRLSVERFSGAGLLGRQVSAVGASVVRNAGDGRPSLERVMVPLGPVHLHLDRSDGLSARPKLALLDLAALTHVALRSETRFDWSASLSAGAPVFRSPGRKVVSSIGEPAGGVMVGGTIVLSDLPSDKLRITFPHERVHVLQHDFASIVWSDPVESRLLRRSGFGRTVHRYVELGVAAPAAAAALGLLLDLDYEDRPHEIEAFFLTEGR